MKRCVMARFCATDSDSRARTAAWRWLLVAALAAGCLLGAVSPASAQGLDGVSFYDSNVQITDVQCQVDGTSTFNYRASGEASAYGTFTETGSVVIAPQVEQFGGPFPDAPWVKLTADFSITSNGIEVVTGTKKLKATTYNFPYNEAVCAEFPNPTAPDVTSGYAWGGTSDRLEYTARFTKDTGTKCKDSGQSYLTFADFNYVWSGAPQVGRIFFELFTSTSFKC
jgi:hypothetical protein